jgi:hypothetical protein
MGAWGEAAAQRNSQLTVIVYNDAGVPERVVKQAKEIAERIYRNAGVAIAWRERVDSDAEGVAFSVRIVPNSLNLPGDDFGVAFMGSDGLGMQADVFYSGIKRVVQSSSVGAAEILGHVMAHELGHLLLGLDSHSNLGIMQAHWTSGQLRQIAMGILAFDKRESGTMRARLLGPYAALRSRTKTAPMSNVTKAFSPQM